MRELGGAEPGDEVAAADVARLLHGLEDRVDADEAARDAFGEDRLAGDDAVAVEELPGEGVRALGGGRRRLPESRDERPPAGAGRGTRAPERARPRRDDRAPSSGSSRRPLGRTLAAAPACRS